MSSGSRKCVRQPKGMCSYARSVLCPKPDESLIHQKLDKIIAMLNGLKYAAPTPKKEAGVKNYADWADGMADKLLKKYAKDPSKALKNFEKLQKEIPPPPPPPKKPSADKPKRRINPIPI